MAAVLNCSGGNGDDARQSTADTAADMASVAPTAVPPAVDTAQALTGQPATAAQDPLAPILDSLRAEVARLNETVIALQQTPNPDVTQSDTASADLAAAEVVRDTAESVRFLGIRVIWAALVVLVAVSAMRVVIWLLNALAERSATRRLVFKRLIPIVRLAVWTVVIYYIIAGVFDVDERGLLAAGAATGVALGFAAQDVLKNIFGGLIIVFDQPFQVGDKIRVGETYGEVVSIGLRATRIVTPDDSLVSVPNMAVIGTQIANANAGALDCQVVTDLYLPGWIDVSKAKKIAYEAAANSRYVFLDKPIVVHVKDEFKETFLTHLVVKAYVLDTRYEFAMASDITETAKAGFLEAGMLQPMWDPRFAAGRHPESESAAWESGRP